MYGDLPYAREVGHVGKAGGGGGRAGGAGRGGGGDGGGGGGVATSAVVTEGHDVPPDVMAGVLHWLRKGCATGEAVQVEPMKSKFKAPGTGRLKV
jgi:hypothetical protein